MQPRDLRYALTRPPVLGGALAQLIALIAYLTAVDAPSGTLLVVGLLGGAVAGTIADSVGDAWIRGASASVLGLVAFLIGYVGYGAYLSWRMGTELIVQAHVQFVTALSMWGIPAYLVLGAVAGAVTAYPAQLVRRRIRLAIDR